MKAAVFAALLLVLGAGQAMATPRDELMAVDRAFSRLSVAKGRAYAFLSYDAGNGRLFGTGDAAPIYGRAQAFRRLGAPRERGVMSWEPEAAGASPDGKMGWTDGHWLYVVKSAKTRSTGHYLSVWIKDRRGAWRLQADMGTTDRTAKK